jgi:hypothetical protein
MINFASMKKIEYIDFILDKIALMGINNIPLDNIAFALNNVIRDIYKSSFYEAKNIAASNGEALVGVPQELLSFKAIEVKKEGDYPFFEQKIMLLPADLGLGAIYIDEKLVIKGYENSWVRLKNMLKDEVVAFRRGDKICFWNLPKMVTKVNVHAVFDVDYLEDEDEMPSIAVSRSSDIINATIALLLAPMTNDKK